MSNLVEELGPNYFSERFNSSMFYTTDNRPAYVNATRRWIPDQTVPIICVQGPATKPVTTEEFVPYSFFKDMNVMAVPPLGWRSTAQGRYLAYLSRNNRSYTRGVAPSNITKVLSPLTNFLIEEEALSSEYYQRIPTLVSLVLNPEYLSISEGIKAMREGTLISFCSSANLAFMPADKDCISIYFNNNQVGSIDSKGNINCTIPIISQLLKEQSK